MDVRQERSRDALLAAIVPMIAAMPIAELSITGLVKAAGVTRPTFYKHFPDLPSAARAAALERLDRAFPLPEPVADFGALDQAAMEARIAEQALPLFLHLEAERAFYVRVVEEAGTAGFYDDLIGFTTTRILPDAMEQLAATPETLALTLRFFAGGLTWLAIGWLRQDPRSSPAEMSRQVAAMVTRLGG